ncbi:MAG TPA: helix-turn-helix transcriptional regulator [Actinomycetota bacterium]|nr:helix-turn-helix transcriptional regulator [Actinomycetota bacterium]
MTERERAVDERAVFIISVAAELAGVHPQTLRIYERKGLVRPKRTSGNTRRYSQADVDRLLEIQALTEEGVNLAGVKRIMELRAEIGRLRRQLEDVTSQLAHRRAIAMPGRRSGEIVPLRNVFPTPWETRS